MHLVPIKINYSDGVYSIHRTDEGGKEGWKEDTFIPIELWNAWESFYQQLRVWDSILSRIDNDVFNERKDYK